jgi:HPt (histidine-containing phosphotransfer) domain-containing protein
VSDPLIEELRAHFRASSAARIAEMRTLLESGESGALLRHFHAFAGMGGTYGFPRVSELGERGEGTRDAAVWRELLDAIERELC